MIEKSKNEVVETAMVKLAKFKTDKYASIKKALSEESRKEREEIVQKLASYFVLKGMYENSMVEGLAKAFNFNKTSQHYLEPLNYDYRPSIGPNNLDAFSIASMLLKEITNITRDMNNGK